MSAFSYFALTLIFFEAVTGQVTLIKDTSFFVESTSVYFGDNNSGIIAAFADVNGNGSPDVFVITADGHEVKLFMKGQSKMWIQHIPALGIQWPNDTIVGIAPADFNGDSILDLLVNVKSEGSMSIAAYVYFGSKGNNFKLEEKYVLVSDELVDQPLVADYNADLIADIFGSTGEGTRIFWVYNGTSFEERPLEDGKPLAIPNGNAFVDVDNNLSADLFLVSISESKPIFETWVVSKENGVISWNLLESHGFGSFAVIYFGQSSFVDFDAKGYIDQVVPVCLTDKSCSQSAVYIYRFRKQEWQEIYGPSNTGYISQWQFIPPLDMSEGEISFGLKLREGDYNLDSYVDFVCIMFNSSSQEPQVVVLNNDAGEGLEPKLSFISLENEKSSVVATFADISSMTQLDIIVVTASDEGGASFHLLTNDFSPDANFIIVEVLSDLCDDSSCGTDSYSSNQPGYVVKYTTTTTTGQTAELKATYLSQSAYFSLQVPYAIMGLGQNPNFVDNVIVAIPNTCDTSNVTACQRSENDRVHSWLSLIPNSQLVVYISPDIDPQSWQSKLIIHPSQSVLLTGVVLIGTCCFIALIAGVLHLLERREDDKQKRQEAHKFHFDAM